MVNAGLFAIFLSLLTNNIHKEVTGTMLSITDGCQDQEQDLYIMD